MNEQEQTEITGNILVHKANRATLQCHNCNMRIFWSFATDRWTHTESRGTSCYPGTGPEVAHPRIKT